MIVISHASPSFTAGKVTETLPLTTVKAVDDCEAGPTSVPAAAGMLAIVTHHGMLRLVAMRAGVDVHTIIPNLGGFWFDFDNSETLTNPIAVGVLHEDSIRPAVE